jgi:exosortase
MFRDPVVTRPSSCVHDSVRNRTKYLQLSVLLAGSVALWSQSLASTLELALSSDAYTHILLILPLSLALIYVESKASPATSESSGWVGLILLGTALLLHAFAAWNIGHLSAGDSLSLSTLAVVTWWIGSVILCFGLPIFRSLLFPLCFLFLIVPFPEHVLSWIIGFLQHQSAVAASILFRCARVPVTRDGIMLSIPGLDIEVARECSSIRSSMMLIITTMFLAHLFLRSWWKKALLVVIAIPLSVAKNALRIFTIAELGTRVDPGFLDGRLHRNGGIVFWSLAVAVVVLLLWGLTRSEFRTPVAVEGLAEARASWHRRGR